MPPILRVRCTQPAKVTTSPTFSMRSSPHFLVLYIFEKYIVVFYLLLARETDHSSTYIYKPNFHKYKINTFLAELAVKKKKTARFRAFQAQKQENSKKNALFQPKDLQIQKKAVPLHRNSDKDMHFGV